MVGYVVPISFFLALVSPCIADDVVSIYNDLDRYKSVYAGYKFPPPQALLDDEGFVRYQKKIAEGHCNGALLELAVAFAEKHPEAPHPTLPANDGLPAWESVVAPQHYPQPVFCRTTQKLASRQREIDAAKLEAPRFPQKRADGYDFTSLARAVWRRDIEVDALLRLGMHDYAPALLALAKLSNEGKVLRLTPGYLYFALSRAKRAGLEDPELGRLYSEAQGALSDAERARLAPRIESGVWPRSEALLMD